jgi:hypothetical protein
MIPGIPLHKFIAFNVDIPAENRQTQRLTTTPKFFSNAEVITDAERQQVLAETDEKFPQHSMPSPVLGDGVQGPTLADRLTRWHQRATQCAHGAVEFGLAEQTCKGERPMGAILHPTIDPRQSFLLF